MKLSFMEARTKVKYSKNDLRTEKIESKELRDARAPYIRQLVHSCVLASTAAGLISSGEAFAREQGAANVYNPGVSIGIPAGINPPEGFLVTNSLNYYGATVSAPAPHTSAPGVTTNVISETPRFFWTTPWTLLGASEMMWAAFPFVSVSVETPRGTNHSAGVGNAELTPLNLSWDLGDGFHLENGFGVFIPDGRYKATDKVNIGANFWTFQPDMAVTYLDQDYSITGHVVYNTNTQNPDTLYTSGDQIHGELYGTKSFGRFSIGPVFYYSDQITGDVNNGHVLPRTDMTKPEQFAIGGIVGYNWGPVAIQAYVTEDVVAKNGGNSGTRVWTRLAIPFQSEKETANELVRRAY